MVILPFQLDPRVTQRITAACEDLLAIVIKTRRVIADSRELLERTDAILAADPFLVPGSAVSKVRSRLQSGTAGLKQPDAGSATRRHSDTLANDATHLRTLRDKLARSQITVQRTLDAYEESRELLHRLDHQ